MAGEATYCKEAQAQASVSTKPAVAVYEAAQGGPEGLQVGHLEEHGHGRWEPREEIERRRDCAYSGAESGVFSIADEKPLQQATASECRA